MSPTRRASTVSSLRSAVEGGPPPPVTAAPSAGPPSDSRSTPAPAPSSVPELPARPEKPIRFTLDLQRHQHRFLKQFAVEAEVDAARVMRVLLDHLRDDPELAQRVRADVWEQKTQ